MEEDSTPPEKELVVATLTDSNHKLICLEYPGVVEDESAAIERLGGIKVLSKAHFDSRKLEVRFRPRDQYCTPAFSKTTVGSNLILKLKRRKKENVEGVRYEYSAELMGICNKTYQFLGMADYQVLPPGLSSRFPVDPKDFQMNEPVDMDFCHRDIPSFLPPSYFSKFDKPIDNYGYRQYMKTPKVDSSHEDAVQSKSKGRKYHLAYAISFDSSGVPKEPNPDAVSSINSNNPLVAAVRELFEEEPIWSSAALQWRTKKSQLRIRLVLPLVAYYFTTGPFKRLWVKLGCDPRRDPHYKIYQSLDIRVKEQHVHSQVEGPSDVCDGSAADEDVEEAAFVFFPDRLPTQRQLWYQLRDIRDPDGQQLIHSNDGKETTCTEANGWCEPGTYDKLRKLITSKVKQLAEKVTQENRTLDVVEVA